jgi:hypothetical protein
VFEKRNAHSAFSREDRCGPFRTCLLQANFIELDELTTERLRGWLIKSLQESSYRERADYFQRVILKDTRTG